MQLNTFANLWDYQVDYLEAPNERRGGWSGVARLLLETPEGSKTAYLKRQQNYTSRSCLHPFRGEPTLANEFKMMRHLAKNGVQTPHIIFYEQRRTNADLHAVLMTEDLAGFVPLDVMTENLAALTLAQKRRLLKALASTVRTMHLAHVQNRSLYAKHLFIKEIDGNYEVAVIDLEKSRLSFLPLLRVLTDLATLHYRTNHWTKTSRLYFYMQYYQTQKLAWLHKVICRWIDKQAMKKRNKQTS